MKKLVVCLTAVLLLSVLSGCDLWMSGQYYSEKPHQDDSITNTDTDVEVSSYQQLCDKMEQIVSAGTESCVIYFSGIDTDKMEQYMASAVRYILQDTPVGAYAVEGITFDRGTNSGRPAVAVAVSYNHGRSELLRIRQAKDMKTFSGLIAEALRNCDASLTAKVESYEPMDISQFVQDYMDQNPDVCMELPQVGVAVYPEDGAKRIVELLFSYENSREELRKMQQTVSPIFDSAELYVSGDGEDSEKYLQLYAFLMERHTYKLETSITPAYHLLRHGVGDCKAFATVYAAICRRAGLDCQVVTGTKQGESWYWNVIFNGEQYYYVDLLSCNETGAFSAKLADQMEGYVWDYDLYQPPTEPETTVSE